MKFTLKQRKELKIIEWFIPKNCDWKHFHTGLYDGQIGITNIQENENGMSAEEAFFMQSERGKLPKIVKDKSRLRALLWGKKWRERHIMGEVWDRKYTLMTDFLDEPDYIQDFIYTSFFKLSNNWREKMSKDWRKLT